MRMNNWIKYSLSLGLVALIGACSVATSMDATLEREVEATTELKEKAKEPSTPAPADVVRVKNEIWLGDKSVVEYEGAPIPAYLETKEGITLISNRPITLYEVGDMINKITSIQVRYAPHLEEDLLKNAEENAPSPEQMNAHWADPTKMLVSYRGPLSGLLDEIGSRFGIWWRYDKNEIYFYKFMTKTFVLYSLPTKQSLSSNIGGSSTDSGSGGSSSLTLTNTAELELWSNIEKSITSMIGKDAQLSLDPTNGTISLTATPNEIRRVAHYINEQNARLSRQVAISIKVLQVTIDDSDTFGLNLSSAFKDGKTSIGVASAASGLSSDVTQNLTMTLMPGNWNINASIQALSTQATTNLITSGTVTTLNNKSAPIQVVAAHAVDDGGAQKRFHAGQKSDGQAARQHFEQQIDRNVGHFRHRQKMRHAAEFVADGVNVKAEDGDQQRGAGNADKIGRQLRFFDLHVKDSGKR